jgi:hypothetical protein
MAPTFLSTRSVPILKTASNNIFKALSYKRPAGIPGGRLFWRQNEELRSLAYMLPFLLYIKGIMGSYY